MKDFEFPTVDLKTDGKIARVTSDGRISLTCSDCSEVQVAGRSSGAEPVRFDVCEEPSCDLIDVVGCHPLAAAPSHVVGAAGRSNFVV